MIKGQKDGIEETLEDEKSPLKCKNKRLIGLSEKDLVIQESLWIIKVEILVDGHNGSL